MDGSYFFRLMRVCGFVLLPLLISGGGVAQPAATGVASSASAATADNVSARALHAEAAGYARLKYDEFKRAGVAYDPRLVQRVEQEQRELAAALAARLSKRKGLAGEELYYLGQLQYLAAQSAAAVETMRRFLRELPAQQQLEAREQARTARFVIALHTATSGALEEAELALADYLSHAAEAPASASAPRERYLVETALSDAYRQRRQQPERVIVHARAAFDAARQLVATTPAIVDMAARDEMLLRAAASLSDANLELKRTGEAIAALQDLRKLSVHLTSADLYRRASILLERIVPAVGLMTVPNDPLFAATHLAPEIKAEDWLGLKPTTLAALRGRVVLLDFWAIDCAPCRAALPHMKSWQEQYGKKGLTIIALTHYGSERTAPEQFSELKQFRRAWRLPFGFAVAAIADTARDYRVNTIPTAVLIDRRGVARYLSVGAKETDIAELEQMIERLINEPAN
ncbi:MAG: TlpA family protein disulfide reductase [Pyrinomonadaceae bacterium]|nr:TlpA family protein disulfide reductase [Pyrinomonadaceae bacterium]